MAMSSTPGRWHPVGIGYREHDIGLPGVVAWTIDPRPSATRARILPDGCMDLLWDGDRLVIAGPDTAARWHRDPGGRGWTALRFGAGTGPAALGIPAGEVTDTSPALEQVWAGAAARRLTEQVAEDPTGALRRWVVALAHEGPRPDPLGVAIDVLAREGADVAAMARAVGLGPRQLARRCTGLFGYGPQHLRRIHRLQAAVARMDRGEPLAAVAAHGGFADQAHLSREVRALAGTTATRLRAERAGA